MRFVILKPFFIGTETVEPGQILELEDNDLACRLMTAGRLEPADAATAGRFRRRTFNPWTVLKTNSVSHGDPRLSFR
jgi:hypothetical protein